VKRTFPYAEARSEIADGDLLLYRPRRGFFSRLIMVAGRSRYSHAAMAAWWNDRLMCLETREGHGGRAVLLSSQVQRHPGRWDVYRFRFGCSPLPPGRLITCFRQGAVSAMKDFTGVPYGWGAIFQVALVHLPLVRFFARPATRDDAPLGIPFCAGAVAAAYRAAGFDPVPNLADRATEPGDLARSAAFRYRFTLVP